MELIKNIFFNTDKLIENNKVKVLYNGKLFEENSDELFIHYGFGLQWNNLNDIKMQKTDLGFIIEIQLLEGDSFNFCFRNNNNVWDNNNYNNYIFPLEKSKKSLIITDIENTEIETFDNHLKKSYLLRKKIKIAFQKVIVYIPRFINSLKQKFIKDN